MALLAGTAAVGFISSPVFANTAAPAAQPAADPAPAAEAPEETGIADIVVTAEKRETNLQRTPISISVVNAETLKERHVQSLYDLADGGVPSLRIATFEARQSALTVGIRGIVPLDANQPAREQGVGIYIDGVYLGRQHGLNAGLFDIERIEVLKGPQGTLFGRNTEGGALSLVSKAPTGEFGGRFNAGIGNYGAYTLDAHVDFPEYKGFSLKLDGVVQHQDATTKNPMPDQSGWNYYHRRGLRAAVRWQPFEGLTNDFAYDVAEDQNTPLYSQLLNYNPNNCASGGSNTAPIAISPANGNTACVLPGTAFTGTQGAIRPLAPGVVVNGTSRMDTADIGVPQQDSVDRTHGFTNTLKWKIAPEIELRSITAWRGVNVQQWDNAGGLHRVPVFQPTAACTAAAPCQFSRYSLADLRQTQFSQELQAVGSIANFDYVVGGFYFNEHVSDDAATPNSKGFVTTAVGTNGFATAGNYVDIPFCTASTPLFVGKAVNGCSIDRASEVWSKSYAVYGQVTGNFFENSLHVTLGGRYTHDEKRGVLHFSRNINYDTASAATLALQGYTPLNKTWNRFNPMVTVAYDFSPTIHGYAKYATGYRAGGASSRTSDYRAFNPEDVRSYEIGFKTDFWNRKARFNIAAYMMDRDGSQVDLSTIQPTATGNFNNLVTFNAPGTTKIRGVEADLTLAPIEGLTLNASYVYTYTDIPPVPVTYTDVGNGTSTTVNQKFYIVFTPRNAASGSIDYGLPFGDNGAQAKIHLDANYAQATQAFDQFATLADESFIVNGRLSLADVRLGDKQKVTFSVWVRNMFDYQYIFRRDPSNSLPAVQTTSVAGVPNITVIGNNAGILGDYGNFNAPRTFGAEMSFKF
ncbi:TonB-dependent receptor [Sphingomonas immobilis]|uniref:TonB-dependent receptor n=1 Tax=Sphingomonas immobilis TaxID=3063997 RepID=A0ABT8ZWU5_9SPHN|nr:TonB-dependent receptor [Sphingomonas sp. CA1-15]MDO7841251.1 TonB-dependent receptor [Sphingomonas sp. CA1-15]